MTTQRARLQFQAEIEHFRAGLVEMASLVLTQVERAVSAWEEVDAITAAEVMAADDQVDQRCADLDQKVFNLQLLEAPVAADQRLLHVGLIAVIALERVGDLAVAIADASTSVRPEGAVPEVEALISRMSARSVDTLARAVQAIARGDAELGEEAADEADNVRQMLGEVITAVAAAPDEPETRVWSASAVLVARHLERVANNGAELGGRVRFLVSGEPFVEGGRDLGGRRPARPLSPSRRPPRPLPALPPEAQGRSPRRRAPRARGTRAPRGPTRRPTWSGCWSAAPALPSPSFLPGP